jgi:hypothetical protein
MLYLRILFNYDVQTETIYAKGSGDIKQHAEIQRDTLNTKRYTEYSYQTNHEKFQASAVNTLQSNHDNSQLGPPHQICLRAPSLPAAPLIIDNNKK